MFGISLLRNIIPVTNDEEKKYSNTMLSFFCKQSTLGPLIKCDKTQPEILGPLIRRKNILRRWELGKSHIEMKTLGAVHKSTL